MDSLWGKLNLVVKRFDQGMCNATLARAAAVRLYYATRRQKVQYTA